VRRGVDFLIARQSPNGDWAQEDISGIFNRTCSITYTSYRNVFPLWALGAYVNAYRFRLDARVGAALPPPADKAAAAAAAAAGSDLAASGASQRVAARAGAFFGTTSHFSPRAPAPGSAASAPQPTPASPERTTASVNSRAHPVRSRSRSGARRGDASDDARRRLDVAAADAPAPAASSRRGRASSAGRR